MKIKVYTLFTESHKKLFTDYFLSTFPFRKEIELIVLYRDQKCATGAFESEGFKDTVKYKIECFVDGLNACKDDEIFMFIDPDIQFFGDFYTDIINAIQNFDAVFQNDVFGGANTGFFADKSYKKTKGFFKTLLGNFDINEFKHDQDLTNYLLQNKRSYPTIDINWTFLPETYWTYGHIAAKQNTKTGKYNGAWTQQSDDFEIPKNIKIHHANWTEGVNNKIKLLDIVKQKYDNRF